MSTSAEQPASATVVLSQRVRPGMERPYETWQNGINAAARAFAGFEGAEVMRPVPGVQDDYVIVYRFDSASNLDAWITSSERDEWVSRGEPLFETAPVQHTIATPQTTETRAVTVVVTHRVKPGNDDAYRQWQRGIDIDVRNFVGFVSTEVFEPSVNQRDWVVVFRFDNAKNLEIWLDSKQRAEWLTKAAPLLDSWDLQKISGGLGGWFNVSEVSGGARTAPAWKQGMAVLVGLYPTVMVLVMVLVPHLRGLAMPVRVLLSNVVSVAILTWCVMPCVTWMLRTWLDPRASAQTTAVGAAGLVASYAGMTAVFWAIG